MPEASESFEEVLAWLADDYTQFRFFVERDVVWTVQRRLHDLIQEGELPYKVYNDFPLLRGKRRGLSADLVILGDGVVQVAVELKYEPSHSRDDILPTRFRVVFCMTRVWEKTSSESGSSSMRARLAWHTPS